MSFEKKIFLIDDDPLYTFLTREILESTKIKSDIIDFNDSEIALEYLKKNLNTPEFLPDVIFLDLHMQVLDGWEFIDQFNEMNLSNKKRIVLYVVSSSISPHDIEKSKTRPIVSGFIVKPIKAEQFTEIIGNISGNSSDDN